MRHHRRSRRLGVKTQHRVAMMRNLTLGLIEHGRIRTTVARAKSLKTFVEPLVTRMKNPSLANIRIAISKLSNEGAAMALAKDISPKFMDRPGGYLRILKLSMPRPGDAADMALVEWVDEALVNAYQEMAEGKKKVATAKTAKKVAKKKTGSKSKKAVGEVKTAKASKKAKSEE